MPLTPEDVANKRFPTSRFRAGYEPEPVDQFLDEVEQELYRLLRENDDLNSRLTAAQRAVSEADARVSAAESRAAEAERRAGESQRRLAQLEARAADAETRAAAAETRLSAGASSAIGEEPVVPEAAPVEGVQAEGAQAEGAQAEGVAAERTSPVESATGLLAMAQRTADEYVTAARAEAEHIVDEARAAAEGITADAERIVSEARAAAEGITAEAEERRRSILGSLERDRIDVERKVTELKTFEREYRSRLRDHLAGQLAELDRIVPGTGGPGSPEGADGS